MRAIYRKIRHARYLSKNTSCALSIHQKECRKSLGCALYIRCALSIEKYGNLYLFMAFRMLFTPMKRLRLCTDWQVQCLAKIVNETLSSLEMVWKILTGVTVVGVRSMYRSKTVVIWRICMESRNMGRENVMAYCRIFHQEALHINVLLQLKGIMENVISTLKYAWDDNINHSNF